MRGGLHEAVRINAHARLLALKVSFLTLAAVALLAFFPAGGLPSYIRGEIPRRKPSPPSPGKKEPGAGEIPHEDQTPFAAA
jgi:hypothetical protein